MTSANACEMWAEKLAARKPEDLSSAESAALNVHVASCPNCSVVRQDYDLLTKRIRVLCTPAISFSLPDPANAPWHTQQIGFSGRERRSSESFGQTISHSIRKLPSRRTRVSITLTVASIIIALLILFYVHSSLQKPALVSVKQATITVPAKGFTNVCPLPPHQSNAKCQAHYMGSYTSILNHSTTPMALFLQQNQRVIRGSCTLFLPFNTVRVPISGSIDEKGNFKLDVPLNSLKLIIHFIGSVHLNGSISGTYTSSANQQGFWTVKLSQSLTEPSASWP